MSVAPKRPVLRWHGGKFILAKWIVENLPEHRVYVEPFGGAGSVLMRKPRSYAEVFNDISDDIYNLFWVIQNHYMDLADALRLTPFSRREFEMAHVNHPNPIEKARRLLVRSFMGFGSDSASNPERSTGFRHNANRSGTTPSHDWASYEQHLVGLSERLRGVVIENKDWRECFKYKTADTLIYLDPPYMPEVRKRVGAYKFELNIDDHIELLAAAKAHAGPVVISGYSAPLYETELKDWQRVEKNTHADGALKRIEVLWIKNNHNGDLAK
jgi:DNA adenine methylase